MRDTPPPGQVPRDPETGQQSQATWAVPLLLHPCAVKPDGRKRGKARENEDSEGEPGDRRREQVSTLTTLKGPLKGPQKAQVNSDRRSSLGRARPKSRQSFSSQRSADGFLGVLFVFFVIFFKGFWPAQGQMCLRAFSSR